MAGLSVKIVSGLSGSGKSTALRTLEDEGFFCIDNLPGILILPFVDLCEKRSDIAGIAIGIDVRGQQFWEGVNRALEELTARAYDTEIIFLDAADEVLFRRFSETRRPHPLSKDGDVLAGIQIERGMTLEIRSKARWIVDTTHLNVHQLRRKIIEHLRQREGRVVHVMPVRLQSFGYKYGIPLDSDVVFDVRFLPNPYFEPALKGQSGMDEEVIRFVLDGEEAAAFLERVLPLLVWLVPRFEKEGKFSATISVGCTGGRHRSVVIAEELARRLGRPDTEVFHRDFDNG